MLQTYISRYASVKRGEDKTEHFFRTRTSQSRSLSSVIAKLHNCIPRSTLFTKIQLASCSWCDNTHSKSNLDSACETAGSCHPRSLCCNNNDLPLMFSFCLLLIYHFCSSSNIKLNQGFCPSTKIECSDACFCLRKLRHY